MILTICEKPAQARDIARHLNAHEKRTGYLEGNGYQVTWCLGHLLELAPPEHYRPDITPWRIEKLPVVPDQWKLLIAPQTKKQFNVIKRLLKNTRHVLIASDPDREGECIVREILDYCHYQGKIERLWLQALDDASIKKALAQLKPGSDTESLYHAARLRGRLDWVYGMALTMAASSLYGVNSVLSVGRVQTPTLKLVVDRDRTIEAFKPQPYFVLKAQFVTDNQTSFWATWQAPAAVLNGNGLCLDQSVVAGVAATIDDEPGVIRHFKETEQHQKPPLCFSLSSLQKEASRVWGYSAKQVVDSVQALYETHKAITYPRTDSGYLPDTQHAEVTAVLQALATVDPTLQDLIARCDPNKKAPVWNTKKVTAHHAIIPTLNVQVAISKMSSTELNLYDLICRRYLAQFLGDYTYLQRRVELVCAGETFTAVGHTPLKIGWKQAVQQKRQGDDVMPASATLPTLKTGQSVVHHKTDIENKKTQPPARFTEGTLIEAMKTVGQWVEDAALKKVLKASHGIGTEATRANILETLFKRGYLTRQAKHVTSTKKGRALIDVLPDRIKNPCLTAQWEQKLEAIAEGQGDVTQFVAAQVALLTKILKQLQNDTTDKRAAILQLQSDTQTNKVYLCPTCEVPLRRLKSKKGKTFWGCTRYPNCDFTTWEKQGRPRF